jgi:hypothetical protein
MTATAQTSPTPTVASYFRAFAPTQDWDRLWLWPPDVFALSNLILDHTEAYRFAVSPPPGSVWPPTSRWGEMVAETADRWRQMAGGPGSQIPDLVARHRDIVLHHLDTPLAVLRRGEERELRETLLTLHALADETARDLSSSHEGDATAFESHAWRMMSAHGSLSHIDSTRVRITPKTHSSSRGITIRSMSRYLALTYESIEVNWRRIPPPRPVDHGPRDFNLLLVPWPLEIHPEWFRPTSGPLENMDSDTFGFFRFEPGRPIDLDRLARLIESALRRAGRIDAVVFPETAVHAREVTAIESLLSRYRVRTLFAGVRDGPVDGGLGRNYVHMSVRTARGWEGYRQAKHHRWCLDESQIRQYHLTRSLTPRMRWWEAIDLPARTLEIIDVGIGTTIAPLVCEDLARMDEVADMLRQIGPTLVVALLLDGPQLAGRWPCRYATVFADEPGSTVLTLSSLGMVARSRPPGKPRSRVVAMWSDPISGLHEIELGRGASGILLTATARHETVWTADGRRHERSTPTLTISGVRQIRSQPSRSAA